MLKMVEYQDAKGNTKVAGYMDRTSAYQLTGNRERFAQLMAQGRDATESYCDAFTVELRPDNEGLVARAVKRLCHDTAIVLRIADLQKPVLRKLARKIEYGIQEALQECQTMYDLAHANGDVKGLGKAIELKSRLSKLLSEEINVNHKHGVLDEVATEVLLALKSEAEVRIQRQKKLEQGIVVEGTVVGDPSHGPPLESQSRVPSEAV